MRRVFLVVSTLALLSPKVLLQDPGFHVSEEMLQKVLEQQRKSVEISLEKLLLSKTGSKNSNSTKTTKPASFKPFQNNSDTDTVVYGGTPLKSRTGYEYIARIEWSSLGTAETSTYLLAGVIISSSHILTSAYPLVQANALANSVLGFQPGYRVVVGDLTSEYPEAREEDFVVSWEDISVHPDYIDPKVETQGLVKNNLAIISLPSSITSSTSASYITIEVSKVTNDLTSYDVNVAGWDAVASAAVPAWRLTEATFKGDYCTDSRIADYRSLSCYYSTSAYAGPCDGKNGEGDVGTGVKTQGKKKLISSLDILVAINQFSLCDENSKHYSFGSSMSYSSHFSFVCKQASMCLSYGKPGKWLFEYIPNFLRRFLPV